MPISLRPAKFVIDCMEEAVEGFTPGSYWNGWAMPYFTKEQADAFCVIANAEGSVMHPMEYDAERDVFLAHDNHYPDEPEEYPAVEVDGVKYYPIGAGCWIWDLVDDDPWDGEFSRECWQMAKALAGRLWRALGNGNELVAELYATEGRVEDEAALRDLLTRAHAVVKANDVEISEKLAAHLEVVVAGGSPWAA